MVPPRGDPLRRGPGGDRADAARGGHRSRARRGRGGDRRHDRGGARQPDVVLAVAVPARGDRAPGTPGHGRVARRGAGPAGHGLLRAPRARGLPVRRVDGPCRRHLPHAGRPHRRPGRPAGGSRAARPGSHRPPADHARPRLGRCRVPRLGGASSGAGGRRRDPEHRGPPARGGADPRPAAGRPRRARPAGLHRHHGRLPLRDDLPRHPGPRPRDAGRLPPALRHGGPTRRRRRLRRGHPGRPRPRQPSRTAAGGRGPRRPGPHRRARPHPVGRRRPGLPGPLPRRPPRPPAPRARAPLRAGGTPARG